MPEYRLSRTRAAYVQPAATCAHPHPHRAVWANGSAWWVCSRCETRLLPDPAPAPPPRREAEPDTYWGV